MIDHNHFICHFIFGGHLLNIPKLKKEWNGLCQNRTIPASITIFLSKA